MLKSGFSRLDITPLLGVTIPGYFNKRTASGVLDPIYATAVAFDDGEKRAVIIGLDNIGINQIMLDEIRNIITEKCKIAREGIFISCTHTHLGPGVAKKAVNEGKEEKEIYENPEYTAFLKNRLCDLVSIAIKDFAETKMYYIHGRAENVAFIRRFRIKDGSIKTNPPLGCPDVVEPVGKADEQSSLLILKRSGKPEIGIVNFQVHPDTIGGDEISADYVKFVRDTYERSIPNSKCLYINGANGNLNHRDVLGVNGALEGYARTEHMGRKIAMSVISNYHAAKKLDGDKISFANKSVMVRYNKGKESEIADALQTVKMYREKSPETDEEFQELKKVVPMYVPKALRIVSNIDREEKELYLSAFAVGDVVFAGYPGEPFTELGRYVKDNSKYKLTVVSCCANGFEGYFPTSDAYEGGYESDSAYYIQGSGEKLMEELTKLVNTL
ncbi:MAG: hypothetical protein E7441_08620 [Ruminococcaceae bacterium]|nr:hypothetical protein [Oscillospiraceae bacterium]